MSLSPVDRHTFLWSEYKMRGEGESPNTKRRRDLVAWRAGGEEGLICSLLQRASCRSPPPFTHKSCPLITTSNFLRGEITQVQGRSGWSCRAQESRKIASKCHFVYNFTVQLPTFSTLPPSHLCAHPSSEVRLPNSIRKKTNRGSEIERAR